MVIVTNETRNAGTVPDDVADDEELDGWGPVRPRRSSLPVAAAPADADKLERDLDEPQDPLKT
ncbi:MAG TPA: hypothetical protein VHZ95_18600 [Polyangiales bacterium]|nr:hypothetical protein [Polyangiales bacterium]